MWIYLKLLLTALFWGGTFIAGRILAAELGPFSAAFLRFAVATLCLALFTWKIENRFPRVGGKQFIGLILLAMSGVIAYNIFFFSGLRTIEAGRAAVIIACNPVFIALFSALLFGEKLRPPAIAGIVLSVAGALTVITRGRLDQLWAGGFGRGEALIFGCVLSWVAFSLIGKKVLSGLSPLVSILYAAGIGALALFGPALHEGVAGHFAATSTRAWLAIFYLGFFGTAFGFVWYYQGIKAIGPTRAGLFINFVPISAVVLAFVILGESITPSLFIGTSLVICGVYLTNQGKSAETAGEAAAGEPETKKGSTASG
jgi:drug/metabolite transporter (DMT)-like permease